MREFGLIGYPLSHSFSQKYFTDKFLQRGLSDCRYEAFPIPAITELPSLLQSHPQLVGLNVTIPYKEQVLPYLTERSEVVNAIGACNCIKRTATGWKGYNTDVAGFELSLKKSFPDLPQSALVLGTGGAAKAVMFVLQQLGITYKVVSRDSGKSDLTYAALTSEQLQQALLIINTTPLGMYPQLDQAPPIPYEALTPRHCLFDLIYNPEQTRFLALGLARGARIQNGWEMLVLQAEESWRIWNS